MGVKERSSQGVAGCNFVAGSNEGCKGDVQHSLSWSLAGRPSSSIIGVRISCNLLLSCPAYPGCCLYVSTWKSHVVVTCTLAKQGLLCAASLQPPFGVFATSLAPLQQPSTCCASWQGALLASRAACVLLPSRCPSATRGKAPLALVPLPFLSEESIQRCVLSEFLGNSSFERATPH